MNERERTTLAKLAGDGDVDALQKLVLAYHAQLRTVVARAIDPELRPFLDADDVLQEAYVTAFKAIRNCEFDSAAAFYKWLERIAINQVRPMQRALRTQKRNIARRAACPKRSAATTYPDVVARLTHPQSTPSRQMARQEAAAALLTSLARLTDDQRTVVRMRILEDRPAAEIAETLGKSEAAVHALCHRGLKELRSLIRSITRYLTPAS